MLLILREEHPNKLGPTKKNIRASSDLRAERNLFRDKAGGFRNYRDATSGERGVFLQKDSFNPD
jgi:hypothetical protein